MGCACNRKVVKCSIPSIEKSEIDNNNYSVVKSDKKKNIRISIADCEMTTETGYSMSTGLCKKVSYRFETKRTSRIRKLSHDDLCHILNYVFSNQTVKSFIKAKRKSNEESNLQNSLLQIRDFYQVSISCKKLNRISYMMMKPKQFNIANNHTIVASKIFSIICIDEEDSSGGYKKGRSLSPRSLLYTTNKLPELRMFKNFEIIKDIAADEVDQEQQFVRRISKFKSFG